METINNNTEIEPKQWLTLFFEWMQVNWQYYLTHSNEDCRKAFNDHINTLK